MCRCRGRAPRLFLFLGRAALRAESSDDRHINMDRLIRNDRERLRSHSQALGHASFYIEDIIARGQRNAVIALPIWSHSRDFFLPVFAQND